MSKYEYILSKFKSLSIEDQKQITGGQIASDPYSFWKMIIGYLKGRK